MKLFDGEYRGVCVRLLPRGKKIELLEKIELTDGAAIPAGFVCDADTVPRGLGWLYAWLKGRTVLAAIVHDYRYRAGHDRYTADREMLHIMRWEGVRKRYRKPIYYAVRVFGRWAQ